MLLETFRSLSYWRRGWVGCHIYICWKIYIYFFSSALCKVIHKFLKEIYLFPGKQMEQQCLLTNYTMNYWSKCYFPVVTLFLTLFNFCLNLRGMSSFSEEQWLWLALLLVVLLFCLPKDGSANSKKLLIKTCLSFPLVLSCKYAENVRKKGK